MRIRQIRNATLVIDYAGSRLLVDPWFEAAPWTRVVASHMEAVNHGNVSRAYLRSFTNRLGVGEQVLIPVDGETLSF